MDDEKFKKAIEDFAKDNNISPQELIEFGFDFYEKLDKFLKIILENYQDKKVN